MKKTVFALLLSGALLTPGFSFALSSPNIPLDSPIYLYLEKLSGFGLVTGDFKGIRPYSRSEAARLLTEAEARLGSGQYPALAHDLIARLKELLPREVALRAGPEQAPRFDYKAISSGRLRYVHLDGVPRNYLHSVHDPGGDGVFGIGSGLRPFTPYPYRVLQQGSEGTPLFENNDGVIYRSGDNVDLRGSAEAYLGTSASALVEPMLLWSENGDQTTVRLNRGYLKLWGEGAELEVGRDENWLGVGYRGALTLSNNATNFDQIKLSSPEPVVTRHLWDLKYALILSQFDRTVSDIGDGGAGRQPVLVERQPFFFGAKLSMKPTTNMEFGINLGRQVGGPGVNNSVGDIMRGMIGGTTADNSNTVAGIELRFRFPFLRNSELYGEYSGEDAAAFWPIVESYVAGFYIPRLTDSGKDDLRFEYFRGHQILYTNQTFPEGYMYHGMPIGDSQGGATQEFFLRYSHWFSVRNNLALEWYRTSRGDYGRMTADSDGRYDPNGAMQAVERKIAMRGFWRFPVMGDWDALLSYGRERVENWELQQGITRTNQLFRAELSYRY